MKVNFTADEALTEKMRRLRRRIRTVNGDWIARRELAGVERQRLRMREERRRELMR